jgi:hypothetical protein
MYNRFKAPVLALLLGLVPFLAFIGTSSTVTINGEVVRNEQFNLLGLTCALIGLGIVFTILRPSAPRDLPRKLLAGLAGAVCLLQLAASLSLIRPADWFAQDAGLPELAYDGLSEANRNIVASVVERGDTNEIARDFQNRATFTLDKIHEHQDYADVCHEGRYRLDPEDLADLIAVLPEARQNEIAIEAEQMRRQPPAPQDCSPARTEYAMGELVDDVHQQLDMLAILRDGYAAAEP